MRIDIRWFICVVVVSASIFDVTAVVAQEAATGATDPVTADAGADEIPVLTETSLEEATQKGEAALQAKDYDAALKIYSDLLRAGMANQNNPDAAPNVILQAQLRGFLGRGRALTGLKEFDAAMEDFRFIFDNIDRNNVPTLVASGQLWLEKNDPETALADFQNAIKADRSNVAAQFGLGRALVLLNRAEEAIAPLTRVVTAEPENAEAFRYRGNAYLGIFKLDKSMADFQQAIGLNPDDYESHFMLGAVFLRTEEFEKAVEQFKQAIQLYKPEPGQEDMPYAQGYVTLISAYIELGKNSKDEAVAKAAYEAAVTEANNLLKTLGDKNPAFAQFRALLLYNRGIAERLLDENGAAVRSFSQALELSPESGEILFRRGICFHMLGEDQMAISDFERAAHMSFDDPRCNLWAGLTYAKLGEYHKAIRAYGDALAVSDRYTPAYVNRGLAYMALGEHDKAVADFNEALRLDPTNAEYYYKRGRSHASLRNHQKASESFATALEFNSMHTDAHRHMAEAQQALGHSELATQYRQRADELEAAKSKDGSLPKGPTPNQLNRSSDTPETRRGAVAAKSHGPSGCNQLPRWSHGVVYCDRHN